MKTKIIPALIVMIILAACSPKILMPTQADIDRVSTAHPDYTLTNLEAGKTHYENKCSMCHRLKNPASRTETQWTKIVPNMVNKANKDEVNIDNETEESILQYLTTMAKLEKN